MANVPVSPACGLVNYEHLGFCRDGVQIQTTDLLQLFRSQCEVFSGPTVQLLPQHTNQLRRWKGAFCYCRLLVCVLHVNVEG